MNRYIQSLSFQGLTNWSTVLPLRFLRSFKPLRGRMYTHEISFQCPNDLVNGTVTQVAPNKDTLVGANVLQPHNWIGMSQVISTPFYLGSMMNIWQRRQRLRWGFWPRSLIYHGVVQFSSALSGNGPKALSNRGKPMDCNHSIRFFSDSKRVVKEWKLLVARYSV